MRLQVSEPWFRRRRVGLGWTPASWQGWSVTAAAVAAAVAVLALLHNSPARLPVVILIVGLYALIALLTGGARAAAAPVEAVDEPLALDPPAAVPARSRRNTPASDEHVVAAEGLTKRFGERVAVDEVSFQVAAGEVFGFLGPNGAGKTTTVRMLATLISPTSGSGVVAGLPLTPSNGVEIRQRIAVMPENPGLYLRLTVAENLAFFAGLFGLRQPQERIASALGAVRLGNRADDLCGNLSKGLRQRVALARTLLNDPAIVFLDEPTSGLDPVATRDVHALIDSLRCHGVTVFLTTHRLEEAEELCDRVAILNTSLRTIGRPADLRDRLFTKTLVIRTASPVPAPERLFSGPGVESWQPAGAAATYVLTVSDPRIAAPQVTRSLVAAGAEVLSIAEERHSLEDVYLELVEEDVEASR